MGISGKIRGKLYNRWLATRSLQQLKARLGRRKGVLGLCYHALSEGLDGYPYRTSPKAFDAQLGFLKEVFRLVTVAQAVDILRHDRLSEEARPLAMICFDDGYRCNWTQATAVLERHDAPATLFATRGLISGVGPTYLSETELVALAGHPLWDVGGHGLTHNILTGFLPDDQLDEIAQSAAWLEDVLGRKSRGFAYPQGQFNKAIAETTQQFFDYGLATDQRLAPNLDLYQLRRFCPMRAHDDLHRFAQALNKAPMEGA